MCKKIGLPGSRGRLKSRHRRCSSLRTGKSARVSSESIVLQNKLCVIGSSRRGKYHKDFLCIIRHPDIQNTISPFFYWDRVCDLPLDLLLLSISWTSLTLATAND